MRAMYMSRGSAFIVAMFIAALILVGYSYYTTGTPFVGISDIADIFKSNPVQIGVISFIAFITGYLLGRSSY
ncbi:MAG: hypothetical protein ACPLX8_00765 [Nanopusillaceae archaeon]